ncbi:MAG: glycosyltransferase family 2 protein [Hydrogenothermaceae bacterium]|nr:glycosyltransferase family 2 protein [Hydrogenothermaceae bacterium]
MKHPKVSILIATYNQEAYIKDAIYSALGLNYPNLEVIVSDDSSTDNAFDILRDIRDDRVRTYRNKRNIGRILNHRKLLYELARGEVVVFLDGDDFYLDKDFLLEAVELFK